MPRKKKTELKTAVIEPPAPNGEAKATALEANVPPPEQVTGTRTSAHTEKVDEPAPDSGPAYKAIFTATAKGFELGEYRRFKQRVFIFKERPDDAILAKLKENGFTYRAAEKAWTIPANAESRVLSDRLAKEFAGGERSPGRR